MEELTGEMKRMIKIIKINKDKIDNQQIEIGILQKKIKVKDDKIGELEMLVCQKV